MVDPLQKNWDRKKNIYLYFGHTPKINFLLPKKVGAPQNNKIWTLFKKIVCPPIFFSLYQWWYYPHRSGDSVSPVCGFFRVNLKKKYHVFIFQVCVILLYLQQVLYSLKHKYHLRVIPYESYPVITGKKR